MSANSGLGHKFYSKYGPGDFMCLTVDPEQEVGQITNVSFGPDMTTLYAITWPDGHSTTHFDIEIRYAPQDWIDDIENRDESSMWNEDDEDEEAEW